MATDSPRNFIISYSARVGSSALVDTLGRLDSVVVPIFEDLDWFEIERRGLTDKQTPDNIHEVVGQIFRNKMRENPRCSIGFKWRMFGRPEKLAQTFRENHVVLLNLVRADLLELASSRYLTHIVYQENDAPQFAYADTHDPAKREELLQRYRTRQVEADIPRLIALCDEYIAGEHKRLQFLDALHTEGATICTILYEDFAYKRLHFMRVFLNFLGLPPMTAFPPTRMTKISRSDPSELFTNRDALLASREMFERACAWEEIVFRGNFPVICA